HTHTHTLTYAQALQYQQKRPGQLCGLLSPQDSHRTHRHTHTHSHPHTHTHTHTRYPRRTPTGPRLYVQSLGQRLSLPQPTPPQHPPSNSVERREGERESRGE